jgi:hypothetical protein
MNKSNKQRQAEYKKRQKELGLVRVEYWIRPEHRIKATKYLAKLA